MVGYTVKIIRGKKLSDVFWVASLICIVVTGSGHNY
jgi:hypothetical protein